MLVRGRVVRGRERLCVVVRGRKGLKSSYEVVGSRKSS